MAGSEIEPANSTSGEEEEASTEISDSESEPPSSKIPQLPLNSSSDDSGSESDPEKPDPSIKPISSKPMDADVTLAKKSRSKNPTSRYSPPAFNQSAAKRPPAEADGGDAKRVKKATAVGAAAPEAELGGEKKLLFQRLWSEENEIELIQGMIDYVEQKCKDPLSDVNDFYEFVNNSLHIEVNNRQVLTKGRRLKKKFKNNVAKVEKNGKVRSFSNPHEKKMYELSKNLWGSDSTNNVVMNSSSKKVNVTPKTNNPKSPKPGKMVKMVKTVSLGVGNGGIEVGKGKGKRVEVNGSELVTEEMIMSAGLEKMSGTKRGEMEKKWKDLKVQELEFFVKKAELLKEQAELVLSAVTKKAGGAK